MFTIAIEETPDHSQYTGRTQVKQDWQINPKHIDPEHGVRDFYSMAIL
jgi:hypothetical protein